MKIEEMKAIISSFMPLNLCSMFNSLECVCVCLSNSLAEITEGIAERSKITDLLAINEFG